jgi:hypothetical protein
MKYFFKNNFTENSIFSLMLATPKKGGVVLKKAAPSFLINFNIRIPLFQKQTDFQNGERR